MTKVDLIKKLIELTQQQAVFLAEEKVEEYIELLDEREQVLVEINKIKQLNEVKTEEEIMLIKELRELDDKNKEEFERQYIEVKNKLRELRLHKQKENMYNNPYAPTNTAGTFFDKSEK